MADYNRNHRRLEGRLLLRRLRVICCGQEQHDHQDQGRWQDMGAHCRAARERPSVRAGRSYKRKGGLDSSDQVPASHDGRRGQLASGGKAPTSNGLWLRCRFSCRCELVTWRVIGNFQSSSLSSSSFPDSTHGWVVGRGGGSPIATWCMLILGLVRQNPRVAPFTSPTSTPRAKGIRPAKPLDKRLAAEHAPNRAPTAASTASSAIRA